MSPMRFGKQRRACCINHKALNRIAGSIGASGPDGLGLLGFRACGLGLGT